MTEINIDMQNLVEVQSSGLNEIEDIILQDNHIEVPEISVEPLMTLPAALCDELLLQEINSIPTKMGFKIGEVADLLGVKQYVLRYWETEFEVLKPKKASNNQRYYTKREVENAFLIRKLLHRDRFSIEGARAALSDLRNFVKTEVKKEKDWTHFNQSVDHLLDEVDHLIVNLRKVQRLFSDEAAAT
jgi:DNA-binding transcriptional MerR regulator